MGWTVHDLLRLRNASSLVSRGPVPAWVNEALSPAPWVVVRRAPREGEFIPVGVRGESRNERFAGYIHWSSIVECASPQNLSFSRAWESAPRRDELPAMRALPRVQAVLGTSGLHWGPVGSVGFELATGVPVAHQTSDLDLVVRLRDFRIPAATIKKMGVILHGNEVCVDLLFETVRGAISLLDYLSGARNLLLRSVSGPSLIPHPLPEIEARELSFLFDFQDKTR